MKAIRRHLKRTKLHLSRARRSIDTARRLALTRGCGSACIGAFTKALADNANLHKHIDDIATRLDVTNPHYKPPKS